MNNNTSSWFISVRFRLRQLTVMLLHTRLKKILAHIFVFVGVLLRILGNKKSGLGFILKGRRVDRVDVANRIIHEIIHNAENGRTEFDEILYTKATLLTIKEYSTRLLILKIPLLEGQNVIEKGVVIFKFTITFPAIYRNLNVRLLSKYFCIILEPSWVGYALPEILVWAALGDEKIFIQSPYKDDYEFLSSLGSNLIPLTLGPADWVDTSKFFKIQNEKKIYDAIYLANFNPLKRVDRYIQAIVNVSKVNPDYKAALVLASHGEAKKEVLATIKCALNSINLTVFSNINQSEINNLFNQSKVNVLVSLREGSNKGLAEGLFSGVPALLIKESAGGNYLHINEQTGRIVPDSKLEDALLWFSEHYIEFNSRDWAMSHIAPTVSAQTLSMALKKDERSAGRQWTTDLKPKVNRPELDYLNEEDRWLLPKREELLEVFSVSSTESAILDFLTKLK